jgi:hypothetical protein
MNCKRCNREIKNPKSVQQGYGPTCWIKMQKGEGTPTHHLLVGKTDADAGKMLFNRFLEDCKKEKGENRRTVYV